VDLGDLHRHGGVQHRPVAALSHADHHRLVDTGRGAADHQPGRRELWRGHRRLHHLRGTGDDLRADRQLRTLVKRIPASLAAALLAGILFKIGSEIFVAAQHRTGLVLGMFFTYLIIKRLSPRYAVLAALVIGTLLSG
jgi:hypothetical protein